MINTTVAVSTPIKLYFNTTTGLTTFTDFKLVKDDALVSAPTYTITEIPTTGIYVFTYTPSSTGKYVVRVAGAIIGYVDVVTKTALTFLKNIEDECLGSWTWNKQAGTLAMLRQDGTELANFTVEETLTAASRERLS